MIYAVDFDGTLCEGRYPEIGEANYELIRFLRQERIRGNKIILNTLREGERLQEAILWCSRQGLTFDAVNDNLPEMKKRYGDNPRKISADRYIDDRNYCQVHVKLPGEVR